MKKILNMAIVFGMLALPCISQTAYADVTLGTGPGAITINNDHVIIDGPPALIGLTVHFIIVGFEGRIPIIKVVIS